MRQEELHGICRISFYREEPDRSVSTSDGGWPDGATEISVVVYGGSRFDLRVGIKREPERGTRPDVHLRRHLTEVLFRCILLV